jgi:hypothetical protein
MTIEELKEVVAECQSIEKINNLLITITISSYLQYSCHTMERTHFFIHTKSWPVESAATMNGYILVYSKKEVENLTKQQVRDDIIKAAVSAYSSGIE